VLRVARRATGLADAVAHHGHHGVITHATFPWTVVVDDVTNPWLALQHEESPGNACFRKGGIVVQ
jgi:hypothetical protein